MSEQQNNDEARITRDPDKTATISPVTGASTTNVKGLLEKRYRPVLMCLSGSQRGKVYKLDKRESVLGRSSEADFVLDDIRASRRHVVVIYDNFENPLEQPVCYVEDLKSRNGTEVNGEKLVERRPLADHDRIVVGKHILGFYFRDESEIHQQESLYETATRDQLTGLFNRHQLDIRLMEEVAISRKIKTPMSLAVIDIDRFKGINDQFGHAIGDDALRHVARLIDDESRETHFAGRWGGEEFVVIMGNAGPERALAHAEHLRTIISSQPLIATDVKISITVSIGVATLGNDDNPESLFLRADKGLYEAKATGRNRVVFTPG